MDAVRRYVTGEALAKLNTLSPSQQEKVMAMVTAAARPKIRRITAALRGGQ